MQQGQPFYCWEINGREMCENSGEANKANQSGDIILGVYIHCGGCEEKIVKSLRGFDGVEGIQVDANNNKVMIKGKKADPIKVAERLRKKSGKHVDLIFPKNPKKEEKKEEKKEQKKKEPAVVEVVLKMYLYCPRCVEDVEKAIRKMKGVLTVQADMEKNLVTVKGAIEPEKLLEFALKKTGKYAEIVKKGNQGQKDDKNEKQGDQNCMKDFYSKYPFELVHAPQLFSDENPNSCSII